VCGIDRKIFFPGRRKEEGGGGDLNFRSFYLSSFRIGVLWFFYFCMASWLLLGGGNGQGLIHEISLVRVLAAFFFFATSLELCLGS